MRGEQNDRGYVLFIKEAFMKYYKIKWRVRYRLPDGKGPHGKTQMPIISKNASGCSWRF